MPPQVYVISIWISISKPTISKPESSTENTTLYKTWNNKFINNNYKLKLYTTLQFTSRAIYKHSILIWGEIIDRSARLYTISIMADSISTYIYILARKVANALHIACVLRTANNLCFNKQSKLVYLCRYISYLYNKTSASDSRIYSDPTSFVCCLRLFVQVIYNWRRVFISNP